MMERLGKIIGYIFAYLIFTTVLFFIISFFNKLSPSWGYLHIASITLVVSLLGIVLKRILE
jgi:hypothetical protein